MEKIHSLVTPPADSDMEAHFSLISQEFLARSQQMRRLLKLHGPSIGAGHEVLLRSFLRDYLPRSVSVGHGFIRESDGTVSGQLDVIVYNSSLYAPLYRIDDFVILPPESVLAAIEVKTTLIKKDFITAL